MIDPWIRDPHDPADRALAGYLVSEFDGGFAEYCSVPAANVHPIEREGLTDVALACSRSTAAHMLHRVELRAGQRVAVTGASGGVGTALVSLAKLRGAIVIAVAGPSKLDAVVARALGDVPASSRDVAGERSTWWRMWWQGPTSVAGSTCSAGAAGT